MNIVTVLGEIAPEDLGVTLMHEHLVYDFTCWLERPQEASNKKLIDEPICLENSGRLRREPFFSRENLFMFDEELVAKELMEFRKAGGNTIIEPTPIGIGRDPLVERSVALKTGVNVIASTGYYVDATHPPSVKEKSTDELAMDMVRDLTIGIGETGIRAGIIAEIGTSYPITPSEKKVLQAAAKAHLQTGAAIQIHPWCYTAGPQYLELIGIMKDEGVDLRKLIMLHMDVALEMETDKMLNIGKEILKTGASVSYDGCGREWYIDSMQFVYPRDTKRIAGIAEFIKSGYVSQIFISQDVFTRLDLQRYGGWGYSHILKNFVPLMKRAGITDKQISTILVENPRRILQF